MNFPEHIREEVATQMERIEDDTDGFNTSERTLFIDALILALETWRDE